jgi:hypothetical protein
LPTAETDSSNRLQWLLEKRTCPMCKMDILKFYGFVEESSPEEEAGIHLV